MSELADLSADEIATYRRAFEERERRKRTERDRHRQKALTAIRRAVRTVAPSYPSLRRVYLFGSVREAPSSRQNAPGGQRAMEKAQAED